MRVGVFAGSFCPVTIGHVDAIERAARLVDKLFVVVGFNSSKHYVIPADARLEMLADAISHIDNAEAVLYDGMMTEFCQKVDATVMIKSVRNALDLQSVIDLSDINQSFWSGDTVFVVGDKAYRHISSSLVRELAGLGKDYAQYVPQICLDKIRKYLDK